MVERAFELTLVEQWRQIEQGPGRRREREALPEPDIAPLEKDAAVDTNAVRIVSRRARDGDVDEAVAGVGGRAGPTGSRLCGG